MANHRVYAKFPDMNKFKALDLSRGNTVDNLIYATLIDNDHIAKTKHFIGIIKDDQPDVLLQIRLVESNKIIYSI